MMISRKKRPRISNNLVAFLVLAAVLLSAGFFFGPSLRSAAAWTFVPLLKAERAAASWARGLADGFRGSAVLAEENRRLKEALAYGEVALLDRNRLYEENLELKERLGRVADPNATLAAVLLAPPAIPYDTLLLDAGERDGVAPGDKVAAAGTVLIGEIVEVYADTSRAVLYSASGQTREAHLALQGLAVTVEGQGSGALRGRIPKDIAVAPGDELLLSGIAGGILGFAEHSESVEGEFLQTVYFRLPVNPLTLRYVDIWRGR